MKHAILALLALLPMSALAETPADSGVTESVGVARVLVLAQCPSEKSGRREPETGAVSAGVIVSDLTGALVTAGLTAVSGALDAASRAKAVGGEGQATFQFYDLSFDPSVPDDLKPEVLKSRIGYGNAGCLIVSIDGPTETPALELDEEAGIEVPPPSLYLEAMLDGTTDSFKIRPLVFAYNSSLKGMGNGPRSAELHVSFSTPSSDDDANHVFAVTRIKLPAIRPGSRLTNLRGYGSRALPLRPTSGAVEQTQSTRQALYAAVKTDEALVDSLNTQIARAKEDIATAKKPTDAMLSKPIDLNRQLADALKKQTVDRAKYDGLPQTPDVINLGTTTVSARLIIIKDANGFEKALATALSGKADSISTSVAGLVNQQKLQVPQWTADKTTYVTAMAIVDVARQAYDTAMTGTDVEAQIAAHKKLVEAEASANGAASDAKLSLPYPQLLSQLGRQ